MWYGEPDKADADLPMPQSAALAIWPPHASTAVFDEAVKYTAIPVELSPT